MKRSKKSVNINRIIIFFFFCTIYKSSYSQIVISNQGAPAATILSGFIGVGLTVSNPVITCPSVAYGTFSGGSGIGVTNGVALTNGTASQLANPESFFMSTSNSTNCSDPQLLALDPLATNDCCILEFDVIPSCNSLTIRFVFGSEEYPNFVGLGFNDAFGFFVTGPNPAGGNYTNKNIALVTGSTICSINNVNSSTNAGFYVNNAGGTQLPFGGYTSAITSSLSVTPCQSYHWKMAIADAGDNSYDSGVLVDFLQCATVLSVSATATAPTCGATNGTATATVTAGMGVLTYTWSPAPGGGQGTANATGLTGGVTYTVTVNDSYACSAAATATVTVPASAGGPVVTNSPLTQTICTGSTSSLVNLTANMVGSTFAWTATATAGITGFSASGTSTIPVQTITNSGSTNGTVTYAITPTAAGCPGAITNYILTILPATTPTFTAIANPCQNATAPVIPTNSTNIPPITGTWSPAVSTAVLGTAVYTFTPTAGQCATTTTLDITVSTPVTPTFAAIGNPCQNATAPVIPTNSTNIPPITGTWSPAVSTAVLGTAVYSFTPTAGQCATTTTLDITVSTAVTPTFAAIANVCQNSVAPVLPLTSINGVSGSWSPAVSTLTAGIITYTFTPIAGLCASTTTTQITVDPEIIPTFTPIGSVCQNTTAPVIPTTSLNIPPITGTWSPAVSTAILGTSIYTFTPIAGQCSTNATVSIAVTTSITPIFSAIASLCQNATAPVLSTSSLNIPPIVGTWSPAVDVSVPATTTYTFIPAIGQCATIATLDIVVNPYPTLFVFPPAAVCYPAKVDLTLQEVTAGSTGTIYYSASSTGLPHLGNPSAISVSGTYYIISENNFGCEVILPIDVVVEPSPQAEFIPTPSTLNLYNLSSTMENNSVGGDSYQWFFMDGGTSAEINPTHIFPDSIFGEQLITLIVTSLNGCKDTTQKVVIINDELIFYVPNTFTPDGDTYNQTFQPIFTSGYDPLVFSMLIYNRWGEVVFETNDASIGWDGTFGENGNMVQEGVYTWKIEFKTNKKDKHQLVTGSINILR